MTHTTYQIFDFLSRQKVGTELQLTFVPRATAAMRHVPGPAVTHTLLITQMVQEGRYLSMELAREEGWGVPPGPFYYSADFARTLPPKFLMVFSRSYPSTSRYGLVDAIAVNSPCLTLTQDAPTDA